MANLPKFTLEHNGKRDHWELVKDSTDRVVATFDTKGEATAGGVLQDAVGANGGSVKICTEDGRYQEERTYPRSRDPKESPG